MELTESQVKDMAKSVALEVTKLIGLSPSSYREPTSVEDGLRQSEIEEQVAADWYHRRAAYAREAGKRSIADLYEDIAKEEDQHRHEFSTAWSQYGQE